MNISKDSKWQFSVNAVKLMPLTSECVGKSNRKLLVAPQQHVF